MSASRQQQLDFMLLVLRRLPHLRFGLKQRPYLSPQTKRDITTLLILDWRCIIYVNIFHSPSLRDRMARLLCDGIWMEKPYYMVHHLTRKGNLHFEVLESQNTARYTQFSQEKEGIMAFRFDYCLG